MAQASLLLESDLREQVATYFEQRAAAIDLGTANIRAGLEFLHDRVLVSDSSVDDGRSPNADLSRVAEVIATVAWCDLSSAFSLWCHRMVLEYFGWAPAGSVLRTDVLPRLLRTELLGSTALAAAIAHLLNETPLPIVARRDGDSLILNGRVNWASNLFPPDFVQVTAAACLDDERRYIVAIPGQLLAPCIDPYPHLLALQATGSSSLTLRDVRLGVEWIITDDLDGFIASIRPPFLLLQSAFCLGLAQRAIAEARSALRGIAEVFRDDLDRLESEAARLAVLVQSGVRDRGRSTPIRELVQLRLDGACLASAAVALEARVIGGRGYVNSSPTARRLREVAFLPIQSPTEGQLRWELSRST